MHFAKNKKKKGNRNGNQDVMKESKGKHPKQPNKEEREVVLDVDFSYC